MKNLENIQEPLPVLFLVVAVALFVPMHWMSEEYGISYTVSLNLIMQVICVIGLWAVVQYAMGIPSFGLLCAAIFGFVLIVARLGKSSFEARDCADFAFLRPECSQSFLVDPWVYGPFVTVGVVISLWFAWQEFIGRFTW